MDSSPPNQTLRVPPAVGGNAGALANRLRERRLHLDQVTRARMERTLVQAWRTHAAASVRAAALAARLRAACACRAASGRPRSQGSAAAGALIALYVFAGDRAVPMAQPRARTSSCASATPRCRAAR